ncbi:histidine kinase [candidate division KSB1 bacterium]|nr:histidine kinase [candidate division KSB1 bacterium]
MRRNVHFLMHAICLFLPLSLQGQSDTLKIDLSPTALVVLQNWEARAGQNGDWIHFSQVTPVEGDSSFAFFRKQILLNGELPETEVLILYFVGLARAFQVYWDGVLLDQNGRLSENPAERRPGSIARLVRIPPRLSQPGLHELMLRVDNDFPRLLLRRNRALFGSLSEYHEQILRGRTARSFSLGFDFLSFLLSVAFFLIGGRHRSYLYFGLHRLCYVLYGGISIALVSERMTTAAHDWLIVSNYIFDPLAYVFLSWFVIFHFSLPHKRIHFFLNLALFLFFYGFWGLKFTMLILLYPIGMISWAVKNKKPGSVLALIGFVELNIVMLITFFKPLSYEMMIADMVFVFFNLLSISRQVRVQAQQAQSANLRALRLESELLKKHIQPHFLMNTLLTIISLIKKQPESAVRLIHALADEFRLVNEMVSQQLVPLAQELEICRKHLQIMGYRRQAAYQLKDRGIDTQAHVPPLIFHTLIENGLTHAFHVGEDGVFDLEGFSNERLTLYRLSNLISATGGDAPGQPADEWEEGLGLRYVRSRLQESFPNRWKLDAGRENGRWCVEIIIYKDNHAAHSHRGR